MNNIIAKNIGDINSISDREFINKLRETLQNIVLIGLARGGFFKNAAFYGGKALRIFYDLDRFSEDLDFTLDKDIENFSFEPYFPFIEKVATSFGFNVTLSEKGKEGNISSAFLKANTYQVMMNFELSKEIVDKVHKDQLLKIKFEVDHTQALGFSTEYKRIFYPDIASIRVLDDSSLFAGKIAALLSRPYSNRVKGRDYYDYLFYVKRNTSINIEYLKNKLIENGIISKGANLTLVDVKEMLKKKFNEVDYKLVIEDVLPFISTNIEDIKSWDASLFIESLEWLR